MMDKFDAIEYLNQSKYFFGIENYEEALNYVNKGIEADKMNIEMYLFKGIIHASMDAYPEAIKSFNDALKINKKCEEAYFHLGNIYLMTNERALGVENYNKAISLGYDDSQLYYNLGLMYEEEGKYDLAIRNYTKVILKDPLRSDARVRKATIYISNNKYPEALETLNELILADPDLYDGYHLKALLLSEMDKLDEAIMVLDEAIQLFPKDPAFILDKVNMYVLKGDTNRAKDEILKLEQTYDMNYEQKRKLELEKSRLYAMESNIDAVVESLIKAREYTVKADPEDLDTEATFLLVNCYLEKKEFKKAAECSKELLARNDLAYAIPSYYTLPYAVAQTGQTEEAKALYKDSIGKLRAITLKNPDILDGYFFRALCHKEIGETDKALELCEYLIKIDEKSKTFHSLKAEVLFAMGLEAEAKAEKELSETLS